MAEPTCETPERPVLALKKALGWNSDDSDADSGPDSGPCTLQMGVSALTPPTAVFAPMKEPRLYSDSDSAGEELLDYDSGSEAEADSSSPERRFPATLKSSPLKETVIASRSTFEALCETFEEDGFAFETDLLLFDELDSVVSKAGALRNIESHVADIIIGTVEAVCSALEKLRDDYAGGNIEELIDGGALAESEDLEATRKKATKEGNHLAAKQTQAKLDAWLDESAAGFAADARRLARNIVADETHSPVESGEHLVQQPMQAIATNITTLDEEKASVMGRLEAVRGIKRDALGRLLSLRAQHEKNEHANKEESKALLEPGGATRATTAEGIAKSDLARQRIIVKSHNRLEEAEASFTLHCQMVEEAERAESEYRTANETLRKIYIDTSACLEALRAALKTSSEFARDARAKRLDFLKGQKKTLLKAMKEIFDKGIWNIGMEHRGKKEKQLKKKEKEWLSARDAYQEAAEDGEDEDELRAKETTLKNADVKRGLAQAGLDEANAKWSNWLEMDIGFGPYENLCDELGDPTNSSVIETVLYEIEAKDIKKEEDKLKTQKEAQQKLEREIAERKARLALTAQRP
jgi:hypothetical protein